MSAVASGASCPTVAATFKISVASVVKWSQRFRSEGSPARGWCCHRGRIQCRGRYDAGHGPGPGNGEAGAASEWHQLQQRRDRRQRQCEQLWHWPRPTGTGRPRRRGARDLGRRWFRGSRHAHARALPAILNVGRAREVLMGGKGGGGEGGGGEGGGGGFMGTPSLFKASSSVTTTSGGRSLGGPHTVSPTASSRPAGRHKSVRGPCVLEGDHPSPQHSQSRGPPARLRSYQIWKSSGNRALVLGGQFIESGEVTGRRPPVKAKTGCPRASQISASNIIAPPEHWRLDPGDSRAALFRSV